jgi:signal transduction histidine kinase
VSEQPAYTLRNSKVISNVVLVGSYLLVAAIAFLLLIGLCLMHTQAVSSLIVCGIAFVYLGTIQLLARLNYDRAVAYLLVLFYTFLATGMVWVWGIDTPIALLIFALVIVLAGILLTARCALCAAVVCGLILVGVQLTIMLGWHMPDMSWSGKTSSFGDVLGYCSVFGMLALVSWLYNREMERSLAQAKEAGAALMQQKATLKMQVSKRTAELRQVQLVEMQQMYRFAELGQLGIILLHDLSNYLTALTLEIEGLQSKQHSKAIARAREIIHYLEGVVKNTRERLNGSTEKQTFNIVQKTSDALAVLHYKTATTGVAIDWEPPKVSWKYTGDATSYCQVIAIITSNAIDAYRTKVPARTTAAAGPPKVVITMQQIGMDIVIKISDWGDGITKSQRKHLFKPYASAKKSGLGLGLYIAKQTVEMQFSGTMVINPWSKHTEFIIKLPLGNPGNDKHDK